MSMSWNGTGPQGDLEHFGKEKFEHDAFEIADFVADLVTASKWKPQYV